MKQALDPYQRKERKVHRCKGDTICTQPMMNTDFEAMRTKAYWEPPEAGKESKDPP
jgi:hypothetical protein